MLQKLHEKRLNLPFGRMQSPSQADRGTLSMHSSGRYEFLHEVGLQRRVRGIGQLGREKRIFCFRLFLCFVEMSHTSNDSPSTSSPSRAWATDGDGDGDGDDSAAATPSESGAFVLMLNLCLFLLLTHCDRDSRVRSDLYGARTHTGRDTSRNFCCLLQEFPLRTIVSNNFQFFSTRS